MEKNILKGALLVGMGAASYGALATVVKLAYQHGFTTAEVSSSQFAVGLLSLLLINGSAKHRSKGTQIISGKDKLKLILGGTSLGLTSVCYYFSVRYIPVSIAIVLLMQSVWMGLCLEALLDKKRPSGAKIIASAIVLAGTGLATNVFSGMHTLNWTGFGWGMAAGLSYTLSLYSSNSIANHLPSMKRSLWLLAGGMLIIILLFSSTGSYRHFNFSIFWPWGIFLALFGTVLPPLLFTSGMPLTGIGLGTIIASIELPVSVTFAYLLLGEAVSAAQWAGILLIIAAVVFMNVRTDRA